MKTLNIHSFCKDGIQEFDRCELQRLLGISNRGVWRKWLIAVGYNPDDRDHKYQWKDVPLLVALKLFLQAKRGRYKHQYIDFLELRENNALNPEILTTAKQLTEKLKHDYYQNNRLAS